MSDPILTERVKLGANALNTLATASITVGVLAPFAAFIYGVSAPTAPVWELALSGLIRVSFAAGRHDAAQPLPGRLRP
ncbi:hypothetical protein [Methylobacterium nigriterrae]|uniref:hypothetical protein n=1 Tax=Methylobacterium nigriterrae TaxID=3127512 RepID=UPI0030139248